MKTTLIFLTKLLLAGGVLTWGMIAQATVESRINYFVYADAVQTSGYCEIGMPMIAEFGMPAEPYMKGLFSKAIAAEHTIGQPLAYKDINVLSDSSFNFQLTNQEYQENQAVWNFNMTMNLSGLSSQANTREKRAEVIETAKLAIIGINANLQEAVGLYKLKLKVMGLPNQSDLEGERVYEETQYPYTSSSPLVAAYRSELINVEGECR